MQRRLYDEATEVHFDENEQMLFLSGPRRVGKTTTALQLKDKHELFYFNWDDQEDRLVLTEGSRAVLDAINYDQERARRPLVTFDEIHKSSIWKQFLKGFFDKYHYQVQILVTGSAHLDVYQKGGDSLMGRYFRYRVHPFSVSELVDPRIPQEPGSLPSPIDDDLWKTLLRFGGFPEPLLRANTQFSNRWSLLRLERLFRDDLRELTQVREVAQMELLAEWLRRSVGSQTSYASLAKRVRISEDTTRRWVEILISLFYVYPVRPWSGNVPRSLTKEPKYYMWDWSSVDDAGARAENFVASHLFKAVQFWSDHGFGNFGLYYLRDREKREVDFCVVRDGQPWILVEVKSKGQGALSPHLHYFTKITGAPHVLEVALDLPYEEINCFNLDRPAIVPARTFLSQLV